jgi:hypothetical protein
LDEELTKLIEYTDTNSPKVMAGIQQAADPSKHVVALVFVFVI